ncbi:MAG: hypothetical protein HZA17_02440 [Nitrospirae bacterium]|nr:hypothetical protein [Nitrospirota bacterium]
MNHNRSVFLLLLTSFFALSAHAAAIGEIKPKSGATLTNTCVWDGKELKPKAGATLKNTWEITGDVPVPVSALVILDIAR